MLIYEMVTGRPPFMHQNHRKLAELIKQGQIIFPHPERHGIPMTEELKDLIRKLLHRDQKKRLGSLNDADDIVNHPWFAGMDWEKLMAKQIVSPFQPDMDQIRNKKSDTIVHADKDIYAGIEESKEDKLVSLEEDERNDAIPLNQQKLIEKNKHKFKDF